MSSKRKHNQTGKHGTGEKDIDYDFFDSPRNDSSPRKRSEQSSGSSSYSSDTDSHDSDDDRRDTTDRTDSSSRQREKRVIRATVPTVSPHSDDDVSSDDEEVSGRKSRADVILAKDDKYQKSRENGKNNKHGHGKSRSRSRSGDRNHSRNSDSDYSDSDGGSTSGSFTDSSENSDMTDVSPLGSPRNERRSKKKVEIGGTTLLGPSKPPKSPMQRDRPRSGRSDVASARSAGSQSPSYSHILNANSDSMNLKLLMQAIMEMEGQRAERPTSAKKFSVPSRPTSADRRNFSFKNDKVRDIDKENTRLMQEIMRVSDRNKKTKLKPKKREQPVTVANRLTPSAVNRIREQKRIEQENRAMLRRLEGAKPTKTLQRDDLLYKFNSSTLFGVPMSVVHPNETRPKSSMQNIYETPVSTTSRSRSAIGVPGDTYSRPTSAKFRPVSAKGRPGSASSSRPQSGKSSRPQSGKRPGSAPRKAWEDGW